MTELGMLTPIVASKREELDARLGNTAIDDLRARATPTRRRLKAALDRPGGRFIFEFKRASPSEGQLSASADPAAIARNYSGVADAMSVLVDPHFRGSHADLQAARAVFDGPILAKDFVIDPRQVVEARIAGADAVLAILAILDDEAAREITDEASRFGMDVLVEVHDEIEMRRALALGAPLLGINNRDLTSFRTDLATTERLAPLAEGRTIVAESGIATRADIDRLASSVDAFLIGSSIMRDPDPHGAARALAFGRVKLCGLRSCADLIAAAPAAYAGLVFVPGSPRAVTVEEAGRLADALTGQPVPPLVGVFQGAPAVAVIDTARRMSLAAIQLHGDEDAATIAEIRGSFDGEIWLAQQPGEPIREGGDRLLFDHARGGTGQAIDWGRAASHPTFAASLLAGGIGAHNARAALALGPHAIDVGSATDAVPGTKDHRKFDQLFDALRPASAKERMKACA
jgi:indole-3-glycerol phosphate synthase/phosphoribosylanthranilate isomerase